MKKAVVFLIVFMLVAQVSSAKSGSIKLLAVSGSEDSQKGSMADLYLEIKEGSGRVFIDSFPLTKVDTQISTRFAKEVACNFLEVDCSAYDFFYTIRANSAIVGGPSAGAAITVLTISVLADLPIDGNAAMTGTINTGGIIGPVGGILPKIDAAAEDGIKKVIIPKYTQINTTNLSEYEEKYGIKIIEVSQLNDAVKELTGKKYPVENEVSLNPTYVETMKDISDDLCKRAGELVNEQYKQDENATAQNLLKKGNDALNVSQYYSAASYCFGSGLNSQYKKLIKELDTEKKQKEKIEEVIGRISDYKNFTKKKELNTLTDLEAYMVVTDRLMEASDRVNDALFYLAENNTNASIYNLAYGIERLNSAMTWSVFFGKPGKSYAITKSTIDESCKKKISEVEERIQYMEIYLPSSTEDIKLEVKKAYEDYNSGASELCLYKASIAKSRIDTLLNTFSISDDDLDQVVEDRLNVVKSIIAKQAKRGTFPILAYSYYEYANSLKEGDKYSALLYLGYALELGSLDIYFEKQKIEMPRINSQYLIAFGSGLSMGFLVSIIIFMSLKKKKTGHLAKFK